MLDVEDRLAGPLFLPIGHFAFSVKIPDWPGQQLSDIAVFELKVVPNSVRADYVTLATFSCAVDA
jgi:hypothetical protein